MSAARRLAVVLLTWNRREDLLACLGSLREQIGPADAVIVADNGSTDGTEAAVRAAHPQVVYVQNGRNLGFAAGNNAGLARALEGGWPWILLLNDDTIVPPGTLDALVAFAESVPGLVAAQPALLSHADPQRVDTLGLVPLRTFGVRDVGMGAPAASVPGAPREIFGPSGAAALLRAATLRRCGLLDESLFVMDEDADLAFRLRLEGGSIHLLPSARILHKRGISGSPAAPQAARLRKLWLQRNTVALALRYWPARWLLLFAPLLAWRAAQALWLAARCPGHDCLPLWRESRARRAGLRRQMTARGLDRWFA